MATKAHGIRQLEEGDLFFFYRPRVGVEEARVRDDVQRLYMVLAARRPRKIYRLFVIGRKKLPELLPGQHPERRNWALNVLVTEDPKDVRRELAAFEYTTETRGERFVPSAKPAAEGRYVLVQHGDHTELAYALELPRKPGPVQEVFGIKDEASLIVAVKNPDVSTPGAPSPPEPPAYPPKLRKKFGARRWFDAEPELLDYESSQLLLLAACEGKEGEEELGIQIDTEDETLAAAEIFRELRLSRARERVKPLVTGELPEKEGSPEEEPLVRRPSAEESPSKARKAAGRKAARRAPSSAALPHLLAGIEFPKRRDELLAFAVPHKDRVENADAAVQLLSLIDDRTYKNMADLMSAIHDAEEGLMAPFACPHDAEVFETRSRYERHMASAHPLPAVSAADIEKALAGIDYPKSKDELIDYAARQVPRNSDVPRVLQMLPERSYRSAADVAKGFGEAQAQIAGEHAGAPG